MTPGIAARTATGIQTVKTMKKYELIYEMSYELV